MTRARNGQFAPAPDGAPLLSTRCKSPAHCRGEDTKRARFAALRTWRTAELVRENRSVMVTF